MTTSDNVLLTSGVILTVLISATVISYTSKFIFTSDKPKKSTNQMYDPDLGLNYSSVCIFSENPHSTTYRKSPCFNKTLLQWYNPWLNHNLWSGFWSEIKARSHPKPVEKSETETEAENVTEAPTPSVTSTTTADRPGDKAKAEVINAEEKPVEFVYSLLVGLLVVSGAVACWEVCKDKLRRNGGAGAKAQDRQCTLAEFTINRHLRRESQQQTGSHLPRQSSLELTAKVTQNLIHQSSLDRAFPKNTSEALSPLESRRNSVPVYLGDIQTTPGGAKLGGKRRSMDVSSDDVSSDSKTRKFRHYIRRH